jgi:hypothetical protein
MVRDSKVAPAAHQPSKAELEEDVSIDATPEALAGAVTRGGAEPREETPQQQLGSTTMTVQPDAASILRDLREAGEKMTAQDHREQTISYALSLAGNGWSDARKEAEQYLDRMQGTAAK